MDSCHQTLNNTKSVMNYLPRTVKEKDPPLTQKKEKKKNNDKKPPILMEGQNYKRTKGVI